MLSKFAVAAGLALLAGVARAEDGSGLSITIYNSDLALVQDSRQIDIGKGRQKLEFRDVSSAIRPETVTLAAEGISIVEQNFDYDLLTPAKLMEKAVGQQVRIVRTNPGNGAEVTETATVLAANDGVVLKIGDRIEVLRDDGVPTRVIFDHLPDNLRARPTLSISVDSVHTGRRPTTLTYLTTGLSWRADYVALFDEKAGKLDLQGWITLTNTSGTGFANAETQLVAGSVGVGGNRPIAGVRRAGSEAHSGPGDALGDYYIYRLPQRTTVAQSQTKQVSFLDAGGVSAKKIYQWSLGGFQSSDQPSSAEVAVDFRNASDGGLGAGLPAGVIRVYQRDTRGDPKFVGENQIGHTPQGSELAIKIGEAFDVTVQPTLVDTASLPFNHTRHEMRYLVHNAKAEPVTVELRQGGLWGDNRVVKESLAGRSIDAYTRGWSVAVPANGEVTVAATLEVW